MAEQNKNINDTYIEQMVEEIEARGLSDQTVKSYKLSMIQFLKHFDNVPADELGVQHIKKFQRHLMKDRELAANSINRYITGIKFFYIHVFNRFEIDHLLPRVKVPSTMPIVLSESEVARMIDSLHSVFWKAVILTLYSAGLRQSEVRNLKTYDVDKERGVFHIRQGKGQKDRQALLSPVTYEALRAYWRMYRIDNEAKSDFLFIPTKNSVGSTAKKLSHSAIGYMVRKAAELAGVKKKFIPIYSVTRLQPIF